MVLMGLHDEEQRSREWVEKRLDFNRDGNYNTFEVRIPLCLDNPMPLLCFKTDNYSSTWRATLSTLSYQCDRIP